MTKAAKLMHSGSQNKNFIVGDIFSEQLHKNSYSAIVANAYGVYYRPDFPRLKRFYDLLSPGGIAFVAIDPLQSMKHFLFAPLGGVINRKIRTYTRVSSGRFVRMAKRAGFKIWIAVDYTPSIGWERKAYFLLKDSN